MGIKQPEGVRDCASKVIIAVDVQCRVAIICDYPGRETVSLTVGIFANKRVESALWWERGNRILEAINVAVADGQTSQELTTAIKSILESNLKYNCSSRPLSKLATTILRKYDTGKESDLDFPNNCYVNMALLEIFNDPNIDDDTKKFIAMYVLIDRKPANPECMSRDDEPEVEDDENEGDLL